MFCVACSGDGSVKLWDVGESKLISNIVSTAGCPINACAIQVTSESISLGERVSQMSEFSVLIRCIVADHQLVYGAGDREVNTEGKMLIIGRDDGLLEGYGLHSRMQVD